MKQQLTRGERVQRLPTYQWGAGEARVASNKRAQTHEDALQPFKSRGESVARGLASRGWQITAVPHKHASLSRSKSYTLTCWWQASSLSSSTATLSQQASAALPPLILHWLP